MVVFRKHSGYLRGTVIPSLPRVTFLPLYGPEISQPANFGKLNINIEAELDIRLRKSGRQFHESAALYLIGTLLVADAVQTDADRIVVVDAAQLLAQADETWTRLGRPTVSDFTFDLFPKGQTHSSYQWRFPRAAHELYVSCNRTK